jgi:2',3'-cyclic-nucleotide 2'-phosphodiesterase (5'-nucleotidase family)
VYTVKYLPRIATALKVHQRQDNIPLIFVFPGDLLSKLEGIEEDYGQTMIRVLNAFDISYGIISVGNHEDMEVPKLLQRIEESKFLWLGSNFADFPSTSTSCLSRSIILEMNDVPTLGFLGLLLNDPKAYGKNPFGGTKILDPLETIPSLIDEIHQQVSESLPIIALTHLETEYDIHVAQTGSFVISFGAHDHNIYKEDVIHNKGITSVVKPGYDAKNFTLVDMIWPSMNPTEQPTINIRIFDSLDYEPDAEVQKLVDAIPLDPAVSSFSVSFLSLCLIFSSFFSESLEGSSQIISNSCLYAR